MSINENDFFRQATKHITGTLDIEVALENCFQFLQQHIPVESMGLIVVDFIAGTAQGIAVAPQNAKSQLFPHNTLIHTRQPLVDNYTSTLLKSGKPFTVVLNNLEDMARVRPISTYDEMDADLREFASRPSKMILALTVDGKRVAFLMLFAEGENLYTQKHADLILALNEPFAIAVSNALAYREMSKLKAILEDDNQFLQSELLHMGSGKIIGSETGLRDVMKMVDLVSPTESPVLLLGETGTGKELIANAVHERSPRHAGPFIKVNCGAIPDGLIDSELFGHEKGAFTGAVAQKRGRFERAKGGTLFLDEVAELTPSAQVRLLRVLQNKEFERVGGTDIISSDARIIAATNRDMSLMIKEKKFREDLWFRLNVFPINIPPLRHRKGDIYQLVQFLIRKKALELKMFPIPQLASGVIERLIELDWPGNVRELENIIERELILNKNKTGFLHFDQIIVSAPSEKQPDITVVEKKTTIDEVMISHIQEALSRTSGRIHGPNGAAQLLGINPNTLRSKMKKLGIPFKKGNS